MSGNIAAPYDPMQSCFDAIAHTMYFVQDSICGLCTTDTKVYTFLIIGRVLQAASLVSISASIAFTFIAGPISLLGLIPAVALGILGTYAAGSPQEIHDMLQMGRPFVPGQPIGLVNNGNNCWINSSLQLLANTPAYQARLRQTPIFAQFLDAYAAAGQNHRKVVPNIDSHAIRQFLHQETSGQISRDHYQEDAAQFFEYLFQGPGAPHAFEQRINGNAPTQRREPMIQIAPGQQQPRPNFQQLFNNYFDHHTDVGQRVQLSFQRPPDDMLIQVKRFYQYMDTSGVLQQGKILDPIDIPERLVLPNQFTRSNEGAQYEWDAFIIHNGTTQDVGHYTAYIKRGQTWWYCSDTNVYEVPESQALSARQHCYICHARKV